MGHQHRPEADDELLAYGDDVNLLCEIVNTVKKNTEALLDAIKEVGIEVNTENTKHVTRLQDKIIV
jgi:hypothetical protein